MADLLKQLDACKPVQTPLTSLSASGVNLGINLWMKDERTNPSGSSKARAAYNILRHEIVAGRLKRNSHVVESSSGNMAIALAFYCAVLRLPFHCMVDKYLTNENRHILRAYGAVIHDVRIRNKNPLASRLSKTINYVDCHARAVWTMQYEHPSVKSAYHLAANEILSQCPKVNYILVAVSTGGTASGIIERLREVHSKAKVIAVDAEGSNALGDSVPMPRLIPGFGSSQRSRFLVDTSGLMISRIGQEDAIKGLQTLSKSGFLVGGSSGAIFRCCQKFVGTHIRRGSNVVLFFPDSGERYMQTLHNPLWLRANGFDPVA